MLTRDEIKKVYDAAPEPRKKLVDSDEVYDAFHEIRKKHNLHLDHAENLALAIDAVILEIEPFEKMKDLLESGMRTVDAGTRTEILKDIDELIFKPLRKRAEELVVRPPAPLTSGIDGTATALHSAPPLPVAPAPPPEPATPPVALAAPPILSQKMPVVPAIEKPTQQPPVPAPKYHGTDPYRELPG